MMPQTEPDIRVFPPRDDGSLGAVRDLFADYVASLDIDLAFQDYDKERDGFPGIYDALLAVEVDGVVVGAVALKQFSEDIVEMKRLYCRPTRRGLGLGRRLAEAIIAEARRLGYKQLYLDTFDSMVEAIALYRKLGFREIAPYYDNPYPGAHFMALDLA